jgi:hypothetical protein
MNLLRGWDEFLHSLASLSPLRNNRNTDCNVRNILNIPEHCTGIAGTSTKLTETEQKNGKNN